MIILKKWHIIYIMYNKVYQVNKNTLIGLFICAITALFSFHISSYIGIDLLELEKSPISPIIIAIILGSLVSNSVKNIQKYTDGYLFSIKYLLKLGIIFLGIRLSISDILNIWITRIIGYNPMYRNFNIYS